MRTDHSQRKYLKDYRQPDFSIEKTELEFTLKPDQTRVRSCLTIRRQTSDLQAPLVLDGVGLKIIDLQLDDEYLDDPDFTYDGEELTIPDVPHEFKLRCTVVINPAANTRLEGLYQSNGVFCTQCEAEGFRHITFYLDRPDVMSVFTTTIRADKQDYPVLLSNGNKIESGENEDRHWVKWSDPYPKPCYLFALVAGDLACVSGEYKTSSGRQVDLQIFTEHHNKDKCDHALTSLQKAMQWDEQVFGLEYDLDLYMIVAVDDFNMGAMENKGLNVFNTQYVLANQQTATDDNFIGIESVIAHEYFHNWTGNRVTCRDWFQLSLKEGLTVFRDQEFSADMQSRAIQRIGDVRMLRTHQFTEDAGPMAHPVRPQSYLEINNFYTVTVYEKGAEVVRMYQTLLGRDGFRKGMDLYFERHDGQAVTTDDFRLAMQEANATDLDQFQRWYDQAGTPVVKLQRIFDTETGRLKLWIKQDPGHTKGDRNEPFHIPLKLALYRQDGEPLALNQQGDLELVFNIRDTEQSLSFDNIPELPLISAFRGFSAPVIIESDLTLDERARLMACDNDPFNQWDAGQQYATRVMLNLIDADQLETNSEVQGLLSAFDSLLHNPDIDQSLLAEMLSLPSEKYLAEMCHPIDVHKIHQVREFIKYQLAQKFEARLAELYESCHQVSYEITPQAIGQRRLKNICLAYLSHLDKPTYLDLIELQFDQADNMTDQLASLGAIADRNGSVRQRLFDAFYQQWSDTALVVDKWFRLQASSRYPQALDDVLGLQRHPAFNIKNPNRARSLIGAFQANSVLFHDPSGRGYEFLADKIIELDAINPQIASRMAQAFLIWRKLIPELSDKMHQQILRIQSRPGLSNDVSELMASCLAEAQ